VTGTNSGIAIAWIVLALVLLMTVSWLALRSLRAIGNSFEMVPHSLKMPLAVLPIVVFASHISEFLHYLAVFTLFHAPEVINAPAPHEKLRKVAEEMGPVPWEKLALAPLAYVILAWFVLAFLSAPAKTGDSGERISRFFLFFKPSQHTRQSVLLGLIVVSGLFLTISALVAIPSFVDGPREAGNAQEWFSSGAYKVPENFTKKLELEDPFAELSITLQTALSPSIQPPLMQAPKRPGSAAPGGAPTKVPQPAAISAAMGLEAAGGGGSAGRASRESYEVLTRQISVLKTEFGLLQSDAETARQRVIRNLEVYRDDLQKTAMLAGIGAFSATGANEDVAKLRDWYRKYHTELLDELTSCHESVKTQHERYRAWARERLFLLSLGSPLTMEEFPPRHLEYSPANPCFQETAAAGAKELPTLSPPSAALGPLGFIAHWLLMTRSIHLALLVGMFGLGLLGSAISRVIRNGRFPEHEGQTTTRDIVRVILSGSSAAVLVYLFINGGLLSLFSRDASQLKANPHALLATCFFAAIFSERIWERIQQSWAVQAEGKGSPKEDVGDAGAKVGGP
jgi:hypothetical protein